MALPAGALTATVTVGGSVGIAGTSAVVSDFTVALDLPARGMQSPGLVWAATGEAVNSFAEDGTAGAITVLADQPGVFASSTVNGAAALVEVRGWPLVARWRTTRGGDSRWHTRRFAAPAAGTTVDVDMLPQDGAAVPGTVTYAQTITYGGGGSAEDIAAAVDDYLTANPPAVTTEGVQDVMGAMVVAAGGTYNDAAGTITLPSGGGSSTITADDTPAAPAEGMSASYLVTSAVTWPAGLVWSTDPDGGVAPTITGTALVSLFTVGGVTRAIMGATFPAVAVPDTTAPTVPAGLSATATGTTTVDLSWSASTDAGGVTGYEYAINAGAAVDAGAGTTETVSGLTAATLYSFTVRAYDAAGNRSAWSTAATATTSASADTTAPTWTATFAMGTPTETAVVATASALATDNVEVTGYEVAYDGVTYAATVPSGSNFTLAGSPSTTYATTKLRAKDAAGNYSTPVLSVPSYTMAASADVTNPTVGTMAASAITSSGFTITVSGAADEAGGSGLHTTPYAFTTDGGTTWTAYQASAVYTASGLAASTGYSCNWRVRDAAGNVSTGTAQTVTTVTTGASNITDSFTRADSTTTLGTTDTGQTWTPHSGVWGISGNAAYISSGTIDGKASVEFGATDMTVTAKLSALGDVARWIFARWSPTPGESGTGYCLALDGSNPITCRLMGSITVIGTTGGGAWTAGDVISLTVKEEAGGTRLISRKNGVEILNYLDTNADRPQSGTRAGIVVSSTSTRWDDFTVVPA